MSKYGINKDRSNDNPETWNFDGAMNKEISTKDKFDAQSWFLAGNEVESDEKIQYEFEEVITDKEDGFSTYFKLFSQPINILLLFLAGVFSGFIAIPINLETSSISVQIIVSVISLLVLIGIVAVRYLLNKNKFNLKRNYVFDFVITIVSAITMSFISNSLGWIAYETYIDFLSILSNNKITDFIYFAVFLVLMIIMLNLYSKKSQKTFYVLIRIFFVFSLAGLTNGFCTFIYSLLDNIFYYDQLYIISITMGIVGCIIFTLINILLFKNNFGRITNEK